MIVGGLPQNLILGLFLLYIDDHALTLEAWSPVSCAVDKKYLHLWWRIYNKINKDLENIKNFFQRTDPGRYKITLHCLHTDTECIADIYVCINSVSPIQGKYTKTIFLHCVIRWHMLIIFIATIYGEIRWVFVVLQPKYSGIIKSISWLLIPWLFASPCHQKPRYWLYRMEGPCPPRGRISSTCVISEMVNYRNCAILCRHINLTRQGLNFPLQWRYGGRDGLSNHRRFDCLLGAVQRKHQSSASLAFERAIHRWPVDSPHKGQ